MGIQVLLNSLIQSVASHQLSERRASFCLRAIRTFISLSTPFEVERNEPRRHPDLVADKEETRLSYPFAGWHSTQNLIARISTFSDPNG